MNSFKNLPLWGHALIALIIVGLGGWYAHTNYIQPRKDEILQKTEELQKLKDEIQKGELLERKLPQLKQEIAELEHQLEELKAIIPPIPDHAQLLQKLTSLADRSRLSIRAYSPQSLQDREFYKEYPIQVDLTGTYHDLAMFFDRLRKQSRIFNISNLRVIAARQGRETIQSNFTATTFIYKEDAPPTDGAAVPPAP